MQDSCNVIQPPKKHVCQGKMYLSKSNMTNPPIKYVLKKLLLISYT